LKLHGLADLRSDNRRLWDFLRLGLRWQQGETRKRRECEGNNAHTQSITDWENKTKFVSASRRNQHARRVCSPENRTPRQSEAATIHFLEFFGPPRRVNS